jgi:hypothetical protein
MCGTKLRLWLRSWSSSLSALTRTAHRSFHHCMIFCVQKNSSLQTPEWVGYTITQVLSQNGWHKELDSLSLSYPASSPLTDIWKRASLKLQQAVLWKFNLSRSHCQISGLGCAHSILPWQIALLRHWRPLKPRTYMRVESRASLPCKLNTGT